MKELHNNKWKSHIPILYEKYKNEHNLTEEKKTEKKVLHWKVLGNMLSTVILFGLVFLSIIGTITLLTPEMKSLLIETVRTGIGG